MILVPLGGHVLLKVDSQHPFEILLGGTADGEAVILDALFDAGEVAEHIGLLFALQPDEDIELPAGCHEHLNAIQVLAVLLQQLSDDGQLLLICPLAIECLVVLKGLLGI